MRALIEAIEAEFRRYRALAESAVGQLDDGELFRTGEAGGNSVAILVWHLGGNLASRFTDFLTSDGEKPWRDRESEFAARSVPRAELLAHWGRGFDVLFATLSELSDDSLARTVRIRGAELTVHAALLRSLGHVSYHVGQMVLVARSLRGERWRFLTIPPGGSEAYNRNPTLEHAGDHAARLEEPGRP